MIEFSDNYSASQAAAWMNEARVAYELAEQLRLLPNDFAVLLRLETLAASLNKMQDLSLACDAPNIKTLFHYIADWRLEPITARPFDAADDFLADLRGFMRPVDEAYAAWVESSDDWGMRRRGRSVL